MITEPRTATIKNLELTFLDYALRPLLFRKMLLLFGKCQKRFWNLLEVAWTLCAELEPGVRRTERCQEKYRIEELMALSPAVSAHATLDRMHLNQKNRSRQQ